MQAMVVAGLLGFLLHVTLGRLIQPIVSRAMQGVAIKQPPYGTAITALAAATSLLPAAVLALVFYALGSYIPARSRLIKGLLFGAVILAIKGQLFREPIMAIAIGNPVWIALLQQTEKWAANLGMCLTIALLVPLRLPRP